MEIMWIEKILLVVIVFAISLGTAAYSTLAERKVSAFLQDRIGPNRAGIFGILQPIADGVKLFFKEEIIPANADRFLFVLGPSLFMITALMTSAVIPWGKPLDLGGRMFDLQVTDINIGVLYVFAVVSIGVYGIMIGGWASNNKYSLMGALRASSQMISYELAMGLSIIALIMMSGSMSLKEIVAQQSGELYGISFLKGMNWNIFYQPLGFLIFIVCAFAECNRTPFDLPECEAELVGGYHTEYSSMKLGLYLFAEYVNMFVSSAMMASLYFGGYNVPFLEMLNLPYNVEVFVGVLAFFTKIIFFIFFFMWIRWTIPRFRYDQLMKLGWKVLIPLAILNILLTGFGMILTK
ncbi:MAG: NADH-quinone oxidoreductase subunit NuoH [Cytophagaceae bacterium]|nr:NADH-quinone oxidoreductase subunit NuoH [Cytophagaceae bacterium]MDW8455976.1 NADH-quinone oxidoreductase subunit NuoH [Cytophagaceae bacterium]